jgi:hypothetical protein
LILVPPKFISMPFDIDVTITIDSDKQEIQQVEGINIPKIVRLSTKSNKYSLNNKYDLRIEGK